MAARLPILICSYGWTISHKTGVCHEHDLLALEMCMLESGVIVVNYNMIFQYDVCKDRLIGWCKKDVTPVC